MRHAALLVAVMAAVTMFLRFLPFLIFTKDRETPPYILRLGRVLPPAVSGMLVVYCLRNTDLTAAPFGLPELISVLCAAGLQVWRRNSLLSILGGTILYMVLVQAVF